MIRVMRCLWLSLALLMGCYDAAEYRPAKGAPDYPSVKNSYRVTAAPGCPSLGFVRKAHSLEDVASTAAAHGADKYLIVDDLGDASHWTDSRPSQKHSFVAEIFRCQLDGLR